MAAVQVILLEDIKGLGRKEEAVKVKPGYAFNFLVPQGKAMFATPRRLEIAEQKLAEVLIQKERIQEQADEIKKQLEELKSIVLSKKTSDTESLYGSVAEKDVIEAVEDAINVRLEKKHVKMDGHIKTLGEHKVMIRVAEGVTVDLGVEVKAAK